MWELINKQRDGEALVLSMLALGLFVFLPTLVLTGVFIYKMTKLFVGGC